MVEEKDKDEQGCGAVGDGGEGNEGGSLGLPLQCGAATLGSLAGLVLNGRGD